MVSSPLQETTSAASKRPRNVLVVDGNKAAAYGVKLCRPQILAAYPITPQTPLVEYLSQFVADGELDADMVEVESEHSALSVLHGASLAGARVFTGTAGQGLCFMFEPYVRTSSMRLPVVMCLATRETLTPQSVWGGQQDAILVREAGWLQLFVEDNQEILDTVIMAYKIAEHPDILLPINVCYDGFYLSHMSERVEIPEQAMVDGFLPPYRPTHAALDPDNVMSVDPLTPGDLLMEYRYKHLEAMNRAKGVIEEVHQEFGRVFGRHYGGLIEGYRMEDADIAIVAMGSPVGTARVAVDIARERGLRIGLVKVKTLRPFPREALSAALENVRAIGVMDKNVCYGWSSGVVFMELRAAMRDLQSSPPILDFIDGLGGSDITLAHFARAFDLIQAAAEGKTQQEVTWLALESD